PYTAVSLAEIEAKVETVGADYLDGSIRFSTSKSGISSEHMIIDEDGNVGIGTTGPTAPLHIVTDAGEWPTTTTGLILENSNTGGFAFTTPRILFKQHGNDDVFQDFQSAIVGFTNYVLFAHTTDNWATTKYSIQVNPSQFSIIVPTFFNIPSTDASATLFQINKGPNNVLTVGSDGNVGIGTTNPSNKLQVRGGYGGSTAEGLIYVDGTDHSFVAINAPAAKSAGIRIVKDGGSKWMLYSPMSSNDLRLNDYQNGGGFGDMVTFQTGGNVGIGTTGPTGKLDIETPQSVWGVSFLRSGSRVGGLHSNDGILTLQAASGGAYVAVANNGNVGIGTTGPGAKLEVAGQIKISGGSPGAGKVLTSNNSGLATWQTSAFAQSVNIFSLTHAQTYTTAWGYGGDTLYAYLTIRKDGTWTISRKVWCSHYNVWWASASADNVEELCGLGQLVTSDPYATKCIRIYVNANTFGYLGIFGDSTNLANVFISH
ncbi:MAG: hypothetical protein ABIB72_02545, partial [Candidatus Falkowbacteria bacterium]